MTYPIPRSLSLSTTTCQERPGGYHVFISSTFADLKQERQAVIKAVLELNHMPAGMELFLASDDEAWDLIKDVIFEADILLSKLIRKIFPPQRRQCNVEMDLHPSGEFLSIRDDSS